MHEFSLRLIDGSPSRDVLILTRVIKRREYRIYLPPLGRIWVYVVQIIYQGQILGTQFFL